MKKTATKEIKRGQAISFRLPSDTPDYLLKQLQKIKETERRNFSSKIAEFVLQGVSQSFSREKETITIPLPKGLTKAQRDWLKHEHSEALLGSILYHLISDPVRSTALLASLNSNAVNIDEALYLQEEAMASQQVVSADMESDIQQDFTGGMEMEDDLEELTLENLTQIDSPIENQIEEKELDIDDLLGGFLAKMNQ
ncbi:MULTISPECIES: hypothetical protein [Neobacillus]|jgi:hypothetical protein|uniref:Plasmid segregation centromere-binding protein ParR n=1 Tax=Neobacillus sedimentimangrovi TaxID=2699460 RepID=A0ABS8QFP2_9BACI|nr:hypothetical protein [Neobacillus sedimentimangrovi]AIM16498.1 hypothetical protein HW35_09600 [Bacillus sp. X1(2014)]MCD4838058.1 hypothetical protein [Neobacillus sedimentimangrovi]